MKENRLFRQEASRRQFLLNTGQIFLGLSGAALFGCKSDQTPSQNTVEKQFEANFSPAAEQLVENIIQDMDKDMDFFGQKITESDSPYKEMLMAPIIHYWENKENNPQRNQKVIDRIDFQTPGRPLANANFIRYGEQTNFYISIAKLNSPGASFTAPRRAIFVEPTYDPSSLFESTYTYHEVTHALQDTELRKRLVAGNVLEEYINFYLSNQQDPRILIEDEHNAYLLQIYLLDIITDGEFKKTALGPNDVTNFARKMGVDTYNEQIFLSTLQLAEVAYKSGSIPGNPSPEFVSYINQGSLRDGRNLYRVSPNLKIELFEKSPRR